MGTLKYTPGQSRKPVVTVPGAWTVLLVFKPNHCLSHPKNDLSLLYTKIWMVSKCPKTISINFENKPLMESRVTLFSRYVRQLQQKIIIC